MEGLYYPYSENKGADQLHGYREADLRLCFRICKKPVFSGRGSFVNAVNMYVTFNLLILEKQAFFLKIQFLRCPGNQFI